LRGIAAAAGLAALALALVLGAVLADAVSRPVRNLARAADQLAQGDFDVPLGASRLTEVTRLAGAFGAMRRALQARVRELEERQARLTSLQADLIQRDRLATAGRLVVQLAHEIRNPVANIRNCLELIQRHRALDTQTRAYAVMATGELLRLHSMAEHLLDLHRPRWEGGVRCNAVAVACEVADLVRLGPSEGAPAVTVVGSPPADAAISADALKQVLQNLCQNAREAMPNGGSIDVQVRRDAQTIVVEVRDTGPGIPDALLGRLFDPFFTTKSAVDGVGLGLFVADGIIRSHGGKITAGNRGDGGGARFLVTLPVAPISVHPPSRSFAGVSRAAAEVRS
jgi:signal transduction histidine kinase